MPVERERASGDARADEIATAPAPACPDCGREGRTIYRDLADRCFVAPGVWGYRECAECERSWIDPRPRAQSVPLLYRRYFTHAAPAAEGRFLRSLHRGVPAAEGHTCAELSGSERLLGCVLRAAGPLRELGLQSVVWLGRTPGRVLDVGCGTGALLENLAAFGWQGAGIESDPAAAAVATARTGGRIHIGEIESAPFGRHAFDAVTLFHVIEHLCEPRAALERCKSFLAAAGRLVVVTPNLASLGRARFGQSWLHLDPPRHLQLYSLRSLAKQIEEAGFRVLEAFTPATSAYPVFCGSWLIHKRGAVPDLDLSAAPLRTRLAAFAFWGREYVRTRCDRACGEDAVVIAEPIS